MKTPLVKIKTTKQKSTRKLSPSAERRRDQAQQNKRKIIMHAALNLFSRSGVHGTSVEQVADKADVSKTNLLYYFSSKEQLYLEVIINVLVHLAGLTND